MSNAELASGPIGIFDSGYGGLTVFREIDALMPDYDFIYLGDNARAPYGPRDFNTIYDYTSQAVDRLFAKGCPLIILACNTASARALTTIQQVDLPKGPAHRRVLGVIRPTTEVIADFSKNGHIGVVATIGTVTSNTYLFEIEKMPRETCVTQQACPLWVPLVENGEQDTPGADYFVKKNIDELLAKDPLIDTLLLACTHYPLLIKKISQHTPENINIISQGQLVAVSLQNYLQRHTALDQLCLKNGSRSFLTTGDARMFEEKALDFLSHSIRAERIKLD